MMINHSHADDRDMDTPLKGAADNILSQTDLLTKLCPRLWRNDHAYYVKLHIAFGISASKQPA